MHGLWVRRVLAGGWSGQPEATQGSSGKSSGQIVNISENGRELTSFNSSVGTWQALTAPKEGGGISEMQNLSDFPLFIY